MGTDIAAWLDGHGLGRYLEVFARNEVDLAILSDLTDDDLRELGLPLGARRKLQRAIAELRDGEGSATASPASPPVPAAPISAPAEAPAAERLQITLLFCDLVGSTELSVQLDPEDLRSVLLRFQGACAEQVGRFGGTIAKFMGDGALAYFGYPHAHEDDAERAIRAGLGIVEALAALRGSAELPSPPVRIGIATGRVIVGDLIGEGPSQEAAVTGETPNLAARLQGIADPDSIVIDEATERLAGGLFELRDLGLPELKGFGATRRAFAVAAPLRAESRFAATRRERISELVGRDEELELLLRRWQDACGGDGRLVLVSGEPGIGKSRLVHALLVRVAAEPHVRLRYQCSPFHTNSALHPVIEQLERAARFDPSDDLAAKLDKLESVIRLGGRPVEEDTPILASLLSIPAGDRYPAAQISPQRRKQLVIEALVGNLAGLAARQPVLFVLEDAHWLDPTTRELLDVTIERLSGLAVLMVITHRPHFDPPWTGRPHATSLTLSGLGRTDSARLASCVVGEAVLPDAILDRIVEKTDGVPLFVEEFTRAAIESALGGAAIPIPATLQDALEARFGRLVAGREILPIGAAIGRTFDHALIEAVAEVDARTLARALEECAAAQLLFVRGEPPDATYTFKHALVQDTAYDSLLRAPRAKIHVRIADALEERFPQVAAEEPEVIAEHRTRGEQVERAIPWWQRAGELATRRFALREAIHHFTRAIEIIHALPEERRLKSCELALWVHLSPLHMTLEGFGSAAADRAYRRAFELAQEVGDHERAFTAQWGIWMMNLMRPARGAQRRSVATMLALGEASDDDGQRLQSYHCSWTTHLFLGEFAIAREHAEAGIALYDPMRHASHKFLYGGHDPGPCARNFLALLLTNVGHLDSATRTGSLELAERIGHPLTLIATHSMLALCALIRRDPDGVDRHNRSALALAEEHGVPRGMWGDAITGYGLALRGRLREGLERMLCTFDEVGAVGQEPFRPHYLGLIAELCGRLDRPEDGLERVEDGIALAERDERLWCLAELHRIRGELLIRLGGTEDEIEECFDRALAFSRGQGALLWQLRAAVGLARYRTSNGRAASARGDLAEAYGMFTEGFDTADLREARALLSEIA